MSGIVAELSLWILLAAADLPCLQGFVKGAVGFGMPMLMISGLATILPGEVALAALILPTVVSNTYQALRQGWRVAWDATWEVPGLSAGHAGCARHQCAAGHCAVPTRLVRRDRSAGGSVQCDAAGGVATAPQAREPAAG